MTAVALVVQRVGAHAPSRSLVEVSGLRVAASHCRAIRHWLSGDAPGDAIPFSYEAVLFVHVMSANLIFVLMPITKLSHAALHAECAIRPPSSAGSGPLIAAAGSRWLCERRRSPGMSVQKAILTDTTLCTGCEKCVEACKQEEEARAGTTPRRWKQRIDDLSSTRYTTMVQSGRRDRFRPQAMPPLPGARVCVRLVSWARCRRRPRWSGRLTIPRGA